MISIIIPVYNVEEFVGRCIESAIAQTYKDIEIVLVDDGSTDSSGKICDEYSKKDCRIKVIHKQNGGLVSARRAGVKESSGEYIYHLDGDDYISEDAIEQLYQKAITDGADLVRGNYMSVNEYGHEITRLSTNFSTVQEWLCDILKKGIWSICNSLIKKDIYKLSVSVPEGISLGEDCIASLQLGLNVKKVSCIDSYTYFYLIRSSSMMNANPNDKQKKNHYSFLLMLEEMDKLADTYRKRNEKCVTTAIEKAIADRVFLRLMSPSAALKKNRKRVFRLYSRHFLTNITIQKIILKDSWKCWVYNWLCIFKFA